MVLLFGSVLSLALVFGASSLDAKSKNKKFKQYNSKFGVMAPGPGGKYRVYAETNYIYRNVDKEYVHGFEVARKDLQRFMGHFEIRFPEPITITPELEKAYTVMEGGKFIRSQSEIHWEVYSSPFWFSPDDPLGNYELKIFIDGELYRTVVYEVVPFEGTLTF
ncbi:hypothetical protein [Pelagicoccus mobilis]|uniref:Uncharacterized protein n=2 Tax=Pelagicoccus mobilis TaxID=415221 RepID=A0A934RY72_9BACT|nr:hypothetical protein [Pelagicoccus mobilis]MBK1876522.1 hypothetical protein [Pelagicoccus mobilis]